MATIDTYLANILSAVYGEEVRGSIYNSISAMNTESSNAMQYASTAKDSAAASASAASSSASAAATSEANAKTSESNAAASERNAKASETAADSSKTAAASSAAAASTSETNAKASETAAAASAAEAKASETAAETSEVNAKVSETNAKASAEAASASASAAETSEANAKAAETSSAAYAKNTVDAAVQALNAKDAAELAAEATADYEANAQAAASEAATSEANAKASAEAAAVSEANASDSADSAKQYSGKPPQPIDGTWWIWNADTGQYEDSGISCELVGPTGNGIQDISLTSGDHSPGSTDIYTVTMTDGSTMTVSVYNGLNGTGTGDVLGIAFDLTLPVSGWQSDGTLNVSDSRLLASATHKYLVAAEEDCRDEYVDCSVRPKDITVNGILTFVCDSDPTIDLTVNVLRFELGANAA